MFDCTIVTNSFLLWAACILFTQKLVKSSLPDAFQLATLLNAYALCSVLSMFFDIFRSLLCISHFSRYCYIRLYFFLLGLDSYSANPRGNNIFYTVYLYYLLSTRHNAAHRNEQGYIDLVEHEWLHKNARCVLYHCGGVVNSPTHLIKKYRCIFPQL